MTMTINPSAHALRFGKVPASLERLHDDITVTPKSDEETQAILKYTDMLERAAQEDSQPQGQWAELMGELNNFMNYLIDLGNTTVAERISQYLKAGNYEAIEAVYQAFKKQPTFMLDEKSPVYAALAKAFEQFKQQAPK